MQRVLILEDDKRVAQALGVRLQAARYETFLAPDPGLGVMLASTYPPDLIISDIWMPVMQGFTFIRRLKSMGLCHVPFIFMSASRKEDLRETAMSMGAAAFFEKPYEPEELLRAVREALSGRLERRS